MTDGWHLCYVRPPAAYFVDTDDLSVLRTSGWDDQHAAGPPHESDEYDVLKVMYDAELERPSRIPVDDVNDGEAPWLVSSSFADAPVKIEPLDTVDDFTEAVREAGGEAYLPAGWHGGAR